jgi:two-component system response regulator PilR (NtrC family)
MIDSQKVLILDDEPDIRELLELTLGRMGLDVTTAGDLAAARRELAAQQFSFCLTDMRLPDGNGLELVSEIADRQPDLPVAVITAHGSVEDAVQALKLGAFDFVSKPVDLEMLRRLVETALRLGEDDQPPDQEREPGQPVPVSVAGLEKLIGSSKAIQRCRDLIHKLSRSQAPVLISGPSGSGKELAARLIHDLGPRAKKPFVPVNCGAIPTELMESEFFGHRKGSFTGANADKEGLFQAADGGTLMLDEVADLPLHMQVKLLRAIQEKAVRPIGERHEVPVDVRILSATHQPLKPLVEADKFRSDLYFRLNVIELAMPSLSDRQEDIPILAEHFLHQITEDWDTEAPAISPTAMNVLMSHPFSGNVRELINILQRAVTLCETEAIEPDDLMLEQLDVETGEAGMPQRPDEQSLDTYMEDIEKQMLEDALLKARYNKTRAAELLGISFRSLRYKLKKFDID